ncbi:MAG: phosphoribosylanthranilate isomerase [Mediterranea sp.]|jgi:phosphoribosylanthranilate isomerase|nr:phosphoribosylanthranilate isomerase [Mediterranea sp.]
MINGKIIKVCGMSEAANIEAVERIADVDLMGFIFYPRSPRHVRGLPEYMPRRARRVGVFVDEELSAVREWVARFGLEYAQLHGDESPEYCRALRREGLKVIKAFSIATSYDLSPTQAYASACDLFLFDTKCDGHGGSGRSFDWDVLHAYAGPVPFLLSGGIGPHDTDALKTFAHPRLAGYDLNSRFETAPGVKDAASLRAFLDELKQ